MQDYTGPFVQESVLSVCKLIFSIFLNYGIFIPSRSKIVWVAGFNKATAEQAIIRSSSQKACFKTQSHSNAALPVAETWHSARALLNKLMQKLSPQLKTSEEHISWHVLQNFDLPNSNPWFWD